MDFSQIVRKTRERHYESSAEFHRKAKLSCTRQAYNAIERGSVPRVDLALEIIRALKMPERFALNIWARSQMPDLASQLAFGDAAIDAGTEYSDFCRPDGTVVAKAPLKLLIEEPRYSEILLFLMARSDIGGATASDIAKALGIDSRRTKNLVSFLVDYGFVQEAERGVFAIVSALNLPAGPEGSALRAAVFAQAAKTFLPQKPDSSCSTITRRLSPEQVQEVRARIASLLASIDALPPAGEDDDIHTIGVFASPRSWGSP